MNKQLLKPLLFVFPVVAIAFFAYRAYQVPGGGENRLLTDPTIQDVDTIINRGDRNIQPIEVVWDHVIRDISDNPIHKASVTIYKNDRDSTGIGVTDSMGKLRVSIPMITLNGDVSKNLLKMYVSNTRKYTKLNFYACLDSFSGVRRDTSRLANVVTGSEKRTSISLFVYDKTGRPFNNFVYSFIKSGVATKGASTTGKATISSYVFDNDISVKIKRQANDVGDIAAFTISNNELKNIGVNTIAVYLK